MEIPNTNVQNIQNDVDIKSKNSNPTTITSGIQITNVRPIEETINAQDNFGYEITPTSSCVSVNADNIINKQPNLSQQTESTVKLTSEMNSAVSSSDSSLSGKRIGYTIDIIIFCLTGVLLACVEFGVFPNVKRGFHCNDQLISYKFNGDTISMTIIIISATFPMILMWTNEAIFYKVTSIKSSRFIQSGRIALRWYIHFLIVMLFHLFIIDIIKVLVGELRPHFLDTCRPDAAINCTEGTFITEYSCTNDQDAFYFVQDSSKSFPSGHSSVSFLEAVFMIWYFNRRIPKIRSRLLVPLIYSIVSLWACLCSLSRITDHRHHWWDVLVGSAIGVLFGILACVYLTKNFKYNHHDTNFTQNSNRPSTNIKRLLPDTNSKDAVILNHVMVK